MSYLTYKTVNSQGLACIRAVTKQLGQRSHAIFEVRDPLNRERCEITCIFVTYLYTHIAYSVETVSCHQAA